MRREKKTENEVQAEDAAGGLVYEYLEVQSSSCQKWLSWGNCNREEKLFCNFVLDIFTCWTELGLIG